MYLERLQIFHFPKPHKISVKLSCSAKILYFIKIIILKIYKIHSRVRLLDMNGE